jgi:hypothetical protein
LTREAADRIAPVSSIEEIEKAVASLAPSEFADFSAWFERFEAERFDRRIEEDAKTGRLDRLAGRPSRNIAKAAPAT